LQANDSAPTSRKDKVRAVLFFVALVGGLVGLSFGYRQLRGSEPGGPCTSTFDCQPSAVCVDKQRCYKSCSQDADCPSPQRCKELSIERRGQKETPLFGTPHACL
jgi:hypothetical protein